MLGLGGWCRAWLAAVAWSGAWMLTLAVWPGLWHDPGEVRLMARKELVSTPDGHFVVQRLVARVRQGMVSGGAYLFEDTAGRPLGAERLHARELQGRLPTPGPSRAAQEQPRWPPDPPPVRGRQPRVLSLRLHESCRERGGEVASPTRAKFPAERWRMVTDASGRRFHLVGWRPGATGGRPVVWFARGGFLDREPRPEAWFEGVGELEARCQASNPEPALRPGIESWQAWPQPASWLVCADGGLLSVDPCSRRWRTLLPPCGIEAFVDIASLSQVLPMPDDLPRGAVLAALAGDQLILVERRNDHVWRYRLPAGVPGQQGRFAVLPDRSLLIALGPPIFVRGMFNTARLTGTEPLVGLRLAPDGRVLERVSVVGDENPPRLRAWRIVLTASCPLLPAWQQRAQYTDEGVAEGLALAWRVNLTLALVTLLRTGRLGWALTLLVFGLPGWLAWLSHGDRTPAPRRRSRLRLEGAPGRRPLWRVAVKEQAELWAGWAVGVGVLLWVVGRGGGSSDYMRGPGEMVPMVGTVAGLLALWVALAQVRHETWPWLLSRPCYRGPLLVTKALVGCGLVLLATVLAAGYATVDFTWPGLAYGPVTWPMLRPLWLLPPAAGSVYLLSFACALGAHGSPVRLAGRWTVGAVALVAATGWLLVASLGPWPEPDPSPLHEPPSSQASWDQTIAGHDLSAWLTVAADGCPILYSIDSSHRPGLPDYVLDSLLGGHRHRGSTGPSDWQSVPAPQRLATAKPVGRTIFLPLMPLGSGRLWYVVCRPPTLRRYHLVCYDQRTRLRVGWVGRRGLVTTPPSEADDFDLADGGLWGNLNLPAYGLFVGDRGRVLHVVDGQHQPEVIAKLPGLTALMPLDNTCQVVTRSADHIGLPSIGAQPTTVYELPADLRSRDLWVVRLADGGLLIDTAPPGGPLVHGQMLVWLDRAGREVRRRAWTSAELRRRVLASWRIEG